MYMEQALTQLEGAGVHPDAADVERLSPLGHAHLNFLGRYQFELPEPIRRGVYRPLRTPEERPLDVI
jgi:hypothetical protein